MFLTRASHCGTVSAVLIHLCVRFSYTNTVCDNSFFVSAHLYLTYCFVWDFVTNVLYLNNSDIFLLRYFLPIVFTWVVLLGVFQLLGQSSEQLSDSLIVQSFCLPSKKKDKTQTPKVYYMKGSDLSFWLCIMRYRWTNLKSSYVTKFLFTICLT